MKRKLLTGLAVVTAIALVAAGCGKAASNQAEEKTEETAEAVEETVEEAVEEQTEAVKEAVDEKKNAAEEAVEEVTPADGPMLGGYQVYDGEVVKILTEDEAALFDKAVSGLVGASYEPVTVLAEQVVSGTNYAYLARISPVVPDPTPKWAVVVVYKDLQGGVKPIVIEDIEIADIETVDGDDTEDLVGAYRIREVSDNAAVLPEDVHAAFSKASQAWVGVSVKPIALLGTQVVSGTNYRMLCHGTTATQNPATYLYVVDMYVDLNGNAQFTSVEIFDLNDYVELDD